MREFGSIRRRPARAVALMFVVGFAGSIAGCGDGSGRGDRAMIDPAKADAERKSAEDALRQSYTPDKLKPKNARR